MHPSIHTPEQLSSTFGTFNEQAIHTQIQVLRHRLNVESITPEVIKQAISVIDLTSLSGTETKTDITRLCQQALSPTHTVRDLHTAAICVYPNQVAHARTRLGTNSLVKIATVAGGFPNGNTPSVDKYAEVQYALAQGCDEVDMVLNRDAFLNGDFNSISTEISHIAKLCGNQAKLKVILETGELGSLTNIRNASLLVMQSLRAGDFIKTSTGKVPTNATPESHQVMLNAIADYYRVTNVPIGLKPAGGIRTAEDAQLYLAATHSVLGRRWLSPNLYRFGASGLLVDLKNKLEGPNQTTHTPTIGY